MGFVTGLKCRECGLDYPQEPLHVCENCFGPLEVVYDYVAIKKTISREKIAAREKNLWRYHELLPIDGEPQAALHSAFPPLLPAPPLPPPLAVTDLYLKP